MSSSNHVNWKNPEGGNISLRNFNICDSLIWLSKETTTIALKILANKTGNTNMVCFGEVRTKFTFKSAFSV